MAHGGFISYGCLWTGYHSSSLRCGSHCLYLHFDVIYGFSLATCLLRQDSEGARACIAADLLSRVGVADSIVC